MNPCPQCGAVPQASDKFCNVCGTPVAAGGPAAFGAPPQQPGAGFGAPPQAGPGAPPQNAYGAPPAPAAGPPRCQMGHEITPGASYCAHGHPIALDAMPFGNDQYGGQGHGAPPGAPPGGLAPPPAQGGFGQAPFGGPAGYGGYPDPNAPPGGGAGFGAPPPQQGGFGGAGPYQQPAPHGYGAPQPGFPPQQQPGYPGGGPDAGVPAPAPNLPPTALRGFLVSYQSNTQGEFWPLNGGRKTVGRAGSGEQVDIPLGDATISSRHAAFVVDAAAGTVQIEDTGSTNGTFVNEEHIGFNGKRDLRDGDRIRFGGYTAIVKIVTQI